MSRRSAHSPAPAGYTYGPTYRAGWWTVARALLFITVGRPRSLARDTLGALADLPIPPLVRGANHMPTSGPFVLIANHYERPGLWMAWPALFAGHLVWERAGQDVRWIAIQEWESFLFHGIPIPARLIRGVFARTFRTYNLLAMAPPHAAPSARVASVRKAVDLVRKGEVVGIMPEGDVGPTPALLPARVGSGGFLLMLTSTGAPLVPVGLYEEAGRLVVHVGPPFALVVPSNVAKADRDTWVRTRAMHRIRALIPTALWGYYEH